MQIHAPGPVPEPTFEGDFVLSGPFPLECGSVLESPRLHYAAYGHLNPEKDNTVLVCHALSGSASVAYWWPALFAQGGILDPESDFILCSNIFGSCYGSTSPSSIDPATGKPYGNNFPLISVRDIVRAQALLLDHLGIEAVKLAIGPSIGAMQALEWAIQYPARVERVIALGATPLGAMGLALNHLQREAIQLDPAWQNGNYSPDQPPRAGLALAREIATISYKSAELFEHRYHRKPNRAGEDPYRWEQGTGLSGERFDVAGYLNYQGEKFNDRFDANSYLSILRTMDTWDPVRGFASASEAFSRIRADVTLVGISSDWLFPPQDVRALAVELQAAEVRCHYREMDSAHGHDAFLAEPFELVRLLKS
jgi:homoserine O-acetyltransferase